MDELQQRFSAGFFSASEKANDGVSNPAVSETVETSEGAATLAGEVMNEVTAESGDRPADDISVAIPADFDPVVAPTPDPLLPEPMSSSTPVSPVPSVPQSEPMLPRFSADATTATETRSPHNAVSSGFWQPAEILPPPDQNELGQGEADASELLPLVQDDDQATGLEDLAAAALVEPFADAEVDAPATDEPMIEAATTTSKATASNALLSSDNSPIQDNSSIQSISESNQQDLQPQDLQPQAIQPQDLQPVRAIAPEPPVETAPQDADEVLHQPNAELAQLRAENQQLYEHIAQMEVLLQECQATLELQMMRSQTQESLIERQTQELEETHRALQQTQTEADRILTELEKSGKILQHQAQELADARRSAVDLQGALEHTQQEVSRYQVVVETLTQELDNSQTRIAHLEETCGQLQQRSLTQDAAIAQTEAYCQELQSRLNRQQRQTLHFRSALERCLGMDLAADFPESEADAPSTIQPWSPENQSDSPPQAASSEESTVQAASQITPQKITPQIAEKIEEQKEVYPSIPMAPTASAPISLPPLGEIPDAEIDEPVEVSPSDIVALLDWNLEETAETADSEPHADEAVDAVEDAEIADEVDELTSEAIAQDTVQSEQSTPLEMPFANVPPDLEQDPLDQPQDQQPQPEQQPAQSDPEPLQQPLANLLSLGAELLNLQGISTPPQPQDTATPENNPSSVASPDGESEPQGNSEAKGEKSLSYSLSESADGDDPETRYSLASVDLPRFSQP